MPLPNPPKGHRWRKVPYKDLFGAELVAAYAEGYWWRAKQHSSFIEPMKNFAYLSVCDDDTEAVWSLKQTPTEPVAPLLPDERSAVYQAIRATLMRAVSAIDGWQGVKPECDRLFLEIADNYSDILEYRKRLEEHHGVL